MTFAPKQTKYDDAHDPYGKTPWRDVPFLVLFIGMLGAIVGTSIAYMPNVDGGGADAINIGDYDSFIYVGLVQSFMSIILSVGVLSLCVTCPSTLIKMCLILQIAITIATTVVCFIVGAIVPGIIFLVFSLIYVWYWFAVQSRIPFATANLKVGVTSLKMNMGILIFSFVIMLAQFAFTIWWALDYYAIQQTFFPCDANGCENINGGVVFGMLLAFFWGQQVFYNVSHVTTCGMTASWWFRPEVSSSFCSQGVTGSFRRATTTSLGSICFGGLLVAIVSAVRAMAENANNSGDGNFFTCMAVCLLRCLEDLIEYFNKWAFVYVAVYGEAYIPSGKSVINLFKNRGWTALITDQLIGNVISIMVLLIGAVCGGIGYIAWVINEDAFVRAESGAQWILLTVGLLLGWSISAVLLRPIMSVVDTVFVCYADAPMELQSHHPQLYQELSGAWGQFHPGFDQSQDNSTEKRQHEREDTRRGYRDPF